MSQSATTQLPTLVHLADGSQPAEAYQLLGRYAQVITLDEPTVEGLRGLALERYSLWGDARALELALAAPEAVESLILEAPSSPDGQPIDSLTIPTLVVYGTADQEVAPETGRLYREHLPNCNYVLVYKAAHHVAADRPEAFASLVSDFLERRDAFIVNRASSLLHP